MRTAVLAIIICCIAVSFACAESEKITFKAQDMALKEAVETLSQKAGVSIQLDPKATGKVTAALTDVELGQILDIIAKSNNLKWKKISFVAKEDGQVTFDQLKAMVVVLESVPLMAVSVEQSGTPAKIAFAKDQAASGDTSADLPDGYVWKTVYAMIAPEAEPATTSSASASSNSDKVKSITEITAQSMMEMASMTPEERRQVYAGQVAAEMALVPEVRQEMLRDRMFVMFNMGDEYRRQFFSDMRSAFGQARELRQQMGLPVPERDSRRGRNRQDSN